MKLVISAVLTIPKFNHDCDVVKASNKDAKEKKNFILTHWYSVVFRSAWFCMTVLGAYM